jgi:hypothetical protein
MSIPQRLFKYEAFSTQSIENLKAHRIYFSSPRNFNDPYDCAVNPVVSAPSEDEVEEIRQHYLSKPSTPEEARRAFETMPVEELQKMLHRAGTEGMASAVDRFLNERGVSCFAERHDDLLMWGHYGGRYKGFCLEFSTNQMPFKEAKQVQYLKEIPQTSVKPFLTERGMEKVTDFFTIKSESWAYEREWRVFHQQAGTLYHYEPESLAGIYFGPLASDESVEIVSLIMQGQNPSVKFYRGSQSRTAFKLDFHEFTYLSHLEAKSRGLI